MKKSLEWHLKCLKNRREGHRIIKRHAEIELQRVAAEQAKADHYERQIEEAKRCGMTEFDADKFLKPRTKKEKTK